MKTLFKEITAKLEAITAIKWVDEDKGQMNFERPPILFPGALVAISLPTTQNMSVLKQHVQAQVTVKLCFDYGGNTNTLTPTANRDASLAFYDVVQEVYKALQGFSTIDFNALERRNFVQIPRPDTYKTVSMVFITECLDFTAAE